MAGRVEWEPLKDLVGELLGDWQPGNGSDYNEAPAEGGYLHVPYDSAQTHIGIAYSSVPYRDPDYFRAWGAVGALGGGMSSRLFTEVRERRGLCYTFMPAITRSAIGPASFAMPAAAPAGPGNARRDPGRIEAACGRDRSQ